ncbi:MAG: hypothetical protein JWQ53_1785, partial [Klenkia sp.]|nr:hypothetical protein [Klenkia sp.]
MTIEVPPAQRYALAEGLRAGAVAAVPARP